MTHQSLTNREGISPSDCPGELVHMASYQDRRLTCEGPIVATIRTYQCGTCGAMFDVDDQGHVRIIPPIVADLARAMTERGRREGRT